MMDLDRYRKLVRTQIDMRRYKTALFWAEKVCTISEYQPKDVYWMAQCLFHLKEYNRAVFVMRNKSLEKSDIFCHYLTVECLLEAKEYAEASELLTNVDCEELAIRGSASTTTTIKPDRKKGNDNSVGGIATAGGGDGSINNNNNNNDQMDIEIDEPSKSEILASIYYLKGKVLEAMDNRISAADSYVHALHYSVYCTEALDALVHHEMLMAWEEKELLTNLPIDEQCSEIDGEILKRLYESKLKKYYKNLFSSTNSDQTIIESGVLMETVREIQKKIDGVNRANSIDVNMKVIGTPAHLSQRLSSSIVFTPNNSASNSKFSQKSSAKRKSMNKFKSGTKNSTMFSQHDKIATYYSREVVNERLNNCIDVQVSNAEELFYNSEYKKALNILDKIVKLDPYHTRILTVQIGCLVELKEWNRLFYLAHQLVNLYPDQAIAWYAVGCYYDAINKNDQARRFLAKSTTLDALFGPAWLAYGHSFAKENEHDQAMAAYFKATQLMRGCHLPLLYIGVECGLTKNLELAEKFFYQSMSIAPLDIYVLHELGVIKYEYERYEEAEEILRITYEMVKSTTKNNDEFVSPKWEPLLNNLGHCCRKFKKYEEALNFHQYALLLKPTNPVTYTAIGFIHAILGNLQEANSALHKSLAIKRDDIFPLTLLQLCLEETVGEPIDFDDKNNFFPSDGLPNGNGVGGGAKSTQSNEGGQIKKNFIVTIPKARSGNSITHQDLKSLKLEFEDISFCTTNTPGETTIATSTSNLSIEDGTSKTASADITPITAVPTNIYDDNTSDMSMDI